MPEAEDVITDIARHATIYARGLWQRHGKDAASPATTLRGMANRLDLLLTAAFGHSYPLRVAQAPAPATFLVRVFKRGAGPRARAALPATDGHGIWLPERLPGVEDPAAAAWYRVLALQQAMRARRGGPAAISALDNPLQRAIFMVLEAQAADRDLAGLLPGLLPALQGFRAAMLRRRPELAEFPAYRRTLEAWVRSLLADSTRMAPDDAAGSAELARALAAGMAGGGPAAAALRPWLFQDWWTGDLRAAPAGREQDMAREAPADAGDEPAPVRSARLPRRPDPRAPVDEEEGERQGAWMVQTSQPHEQAEDPAGMQRPTDRDDSTAAEEFADALSELDQARLVSMPGRPKEVLLSDDLHLPRARRAAADPGGDAPLRYPEWDCRAGAYREPGAAVRVMAPREGPQEWVDRTLAAHRPLLDTVRRRFDLLRAQRVRLRRRLDGDEVDLDAYVEAYADFRAGMPLPQALYQDWRRVRRDMAIMLLIDISGSTDSWIAADKRVIDVQREALLLVCVALQGAGEPYAVLGFSGEGPQGVMVRTVKSFEEAYGAGVARRIAALEPEHYTRTGAALRHASAALMRQAARHRLLLLLSDGKPNDIDDYEGRYGVEDMRQAVVEARLQGIHPFCLTIDRQAASYLPAVFGAHHYALLPRPQALPAALLEWMKRLVASS
ncbi:MAG: nitric oxide reductase activation protein NorD [Noviherbaspirillum sp.]